MRVVLFFAVACGGILLPNVLLVVLLLASPFPYERIGPGPVDPQPTTGRALAAGFAPDARDLQELPDLCGLVPRAAVRAAWSDGTAVGIAAFATTDDAGRAEERLLDRDDWHITERTNALKYRRGVGKGAAGGPLEVFLWTEGAWLFWIEAPTAAALDERVARLPFLRLRAEKPFADRLFTTGIPWLLGGLLVYVLCLVPVFTRTASWAAVVAPAGPPGGAPVAAAELARRLLALNGPDSPFTVTVEGDWATAEWRLVDRKWLQIASANRVRLVHRVRLRLDAEDLTARAQDQQSELRWSVDGLALAAALSWRAIRGITFFEYRYEAQYGFLVEGGRVRFAPAYSFSFNLAELKDPLVKVVTQSGWTYRPVLGFASRALFG